MVLLEWVAGLADHLARIGLAVEFSLASLLAPMFPPSCDCLALFDCTLCSLSLNTVMFVVVGPLYISSSFSRRGDGVDGMAGLSQSLFLVTLCDKQIGFSVSSL